MTSRADPSPGVSAVACRRRLRLPLPAACIVAVREAKRRSGRLKEDFTGFESEIGGACGWVVGHVFVEIFGNGLHYHARHNVIPSVAINPVYR